MMNKNKYKKYQITIVKLMLLNVTIKESTFLTSLVFFSQKSNLEPFLFYLFFFPESLFFFGCWFCILSVLHKNILNGIVRDLASFCDEQIIRKVSGLLSILDIHQH